METTQLVGNDNDIVHVNTKIFMLDVTSQFLISHKSNIELKGKKKCVCVCVCACACAYTHRLVPEPNAWGIFQRKLKYSSCQPFSEKPLFHLWKYFSDYMQFRIITLFTEVMRYSIFLHMKNMYFIT